jgi:hypothetical protein
MICKNCDAEITGKFCANCGQKAELHRITVKHVLHDLFHAFTHADKGVLLLTKQLFTRPGIVAKEYIQGRRKKYFNPLSFLVLTMALSAWLSYKSGYFEAMSTQPRGARKSGISNVIKVDPKMARQANKTNIEDHKIVGLVLITPLIAFLSWILFRRSGYTYAENFVLAAFIFGLANLVRILVFIPLHLALPGKIHMIDGIFQLVFLVFIIIGFKQFFNNRIGITILKSVGFLVLFILLFWVVMYSYAFIKLRVTEMFT